MIRTIIIEDDPTLARTIRRTLQYWCNDLEVVAVLPTLDDARSALHEHEPEFVLADVMLPGGTVIELLAERLPLDFVAVLFSANDSFRAAAAKLGVEDFLSKPFSTPTLIRTLERAVKKVHTNRAAKAYRRLFPLLTPAVTQDLIALTPPAHHPDALVLPVLRDGSAIRTVAPYDVLSVEADGQWSRVRIHPHAARKVVGIGSVQQQGQEPVSSELIVPDARGLREWELLLQRYFPNSTARVHKSHVVNLLHVYAWESHGKDARALFPTGGFVPVARTQRKAFVELWDLVQIRKRLPK